MSDRPDRDPRGIADTPYVVDINQPLPEAGGGIQAFAAFSTRESTAPLMALRVERRVPTRPRALQALGIPIDGLLTPLGHGIGPPIGGRPAYYVVCPAPPGPPVSNSPRPWPEHALIELIMRPVALVLDQLQARGLTHRAIRPNNVFQAPNHPVTLGAAWAAPPAMHQPAISETAYIALCHPAARGGGRIADDVYALGVVLATLAMARPPMDGLDDKTIMYRKLELGDYTAIVGNERLPPMLSDILRGMLAEDPDHRPPPALLRDPVGARGRRVAARPAPRAQRSFKLGAMTVWNNRTLALGMALDPDEALATIMNGTMMYWLRRGLGNSALAVKLEELVRQHTQDLSADKGASNAILVMRAIADADISMPLCWRGLATFPDGLGPVLALNLDEEPALAARLEQIVASEAQGIWASMREERIAAPSQRLEARQRRAILQIKGPAGGLPRLAYTLNPQTPCASPLLDAYWITTVRELAPALDAVAAASPDAELVEPHIAAFVGARSERWLDQEVKALGLDETPAMQTLITLHLLTELQNRYHPAPLKGLTNWVAARARPLEERWQNRQRRGEVADEVKTLAAGGFLQPMLLLLEDKAGHAADAEGLHAALTDLERVDAELYDISASGERRASIATRLGQEIAAGVGLAAIATTLILAALG